MATPLDKPNGKTGCAGKRLVNQLDPVGSQFFKYLWSQASPQSYRHYASGYYNGKSRISAIMQRHVLSHRLDVHKICHVESFFDVSNAFPSASHQALDHAVYATARPTDAELLCQRHRGAVMHIVAHDSAVDVKCHAGAMQGDCPAGPLFLEVYHPQLDTWLRNTQHMPQQSLTLVRDPIFGIEIDSSITTYADDIGKTTIVHDTSDLLTCLQKVNEGLDDALQDI